MRVVVASALLVAAGAVMSPAQAAPGNLDPTFDGDGRVTTDFAGGTDRAFALVRQPDGKLVAAGRFSQPGAVAAGWALARYNADGTLDTTFGSGGKVTTSFTRDGSEAFALVLQPDGKLVAAGTTPSATKAGNDFALARYNPDGTLDTTFGSAGKVTTEFGEGTGNADARALVLQPDGKLVAAGTVFVSDGSAENFALARYNPDGSLDTTFGSSGKVITHFGGSAREAAFALVLQPDGKLVAAGQTQSPRQFALARYNADGSLDTTFDGDGKVTTDVGGQDSEVLALVLQPDGKLVAAGRAIVGGVTQDFALARYNADGSLDTTFDEDGKVTTNFVGLGNDQAFALVLQPNGKLVAAGSAGTGSTSNFALARYNSDGSLDATFGSGGKVTTSFAGDSTALALVLQPDGKLVAGGTGPGVSGTADFALVRYEGDPAGADLSIAKSDAGFDPVNNGDSVTYTLTVTNGGPDGATGVVASDTLPAELDFTSASAGCSETAPGSNVVECPIGSLANGATTTVTITATATASGTFTDTASVTGNEFDPNTANNTATETTTVNPSADLSITKAASVQKVKGLRRVTYTLTVSNAGPDAASGTQLTDTLPAEAMFVSAAATQGSCSTPAPGTTGTVTCTLGSLASSGSATADIVVDVKAKGKTFSVTNTASVTSATADPNPANNSQTITTQVKPL